MTLKNSRQDSNPIIRVGKNRSELVWSNGVRRSIHSPEIVKAQKELNRITRLHNLGPTPSLQQQQNRADSVFEARTQLGHAVRAWARSYGADLKSLNQGAMRSVT